MSIIGEIFGMLGSLVKEMFEAFMEVAPKAFFFTLWVLCGIMILPCVFVAGVLFPAWTEWGEKSF